jgi:hypothetical protein
MTTPNYIKLILLFKKKKPVPKDKQLSLLPVTGYVEIISLLYWNGNSEDPDKQRFCKSCELYPEI